MATQSTLALERAIKIVGSAAELSRRLGAPVCNAHIYNWMNRDKDGVPAEMCPDIERITEGQVRCEELRPDMAEKWAYLRGTDKREAA